MPGTWPSHRQARRPVDEQQIDLMKVPKASRSYHWNSSSIELSWRSSASLTSAT